MKSENKIICPICQKEIVKIGVMGINPKTGKNAMMHKKCFELSKNEN